MAEETRSSSELAANLTIAWLNNPKVRANTEEVTNFLQSVHATLQGFGQSSEAASAAGRQEFVTEDRAESERPAVAEQAAEPAVTVRKSLASREHILSMIDGKPYRTLKRHLGGHGLTPQQYRERFGLKPDYPMVAPAYAEKRRSLAKQIGLGSKTGRKRTSQARPAALKSPAAAKPAAIKASTAAGTGTRKRGRPRKAAAKA